jgi:ribosomal protein L35AE/L33A
MRRYGLVLLLLLFVFAISACSRMPEVVDVAYRKITVFEAPQQIRDMLENTKEQESASVYVVDRVVYILITRGEKMTGGYGVNVVDIDKHILGEDRFGITVRVEYTDPKPGQPVTQAITYPFVIVKTELIDIPMDTQFRFRIDGKELVKYPVSL